MGIVLISGGSGLIGTALTAHALAAGHEVRWLVRKERTGAPVPTFLWNPGKGSIDEQALPGVTHIVHLSGANVADKRWTEKRIRELYDSRIVTADLLLATVQRLGIRPEAFISASGINYYGTFTERTIYTEEDRPANDTLGRLTQEWERAALRWAPLCRTVMLRTPMVLSAKGGALAKLAAPARLGLGSVLGTGMQWVPWVHLDDLVRAYLHAMEDQRMRGPYNIVAPEHILGRDLMAGLSKALHRPFFLPAVPAWVLRTVLGRRADIILLGSRASSGRYQALAGPFTYPELEPALQDLLSPT